jgi:hypothetical protein
LAVLNPRQKNPYDANVQSHLQRPATCRAFSFGAQAATKKDAKAKVEEEFDKVVEFQPIHARDKAAVLANAAAVIDLLCDDLALGRHQRSARPAGDRRAADQRMGRGIQRRRVLPAQERCRARTGAASVIGLLLIVALILALLSLFPLRTPVPLLSIAVVLVILVLILSSWLLPLMPLRVPH